MPKATGLALPIVPHICPLTLYYKGRNMRVMAKKRTHNSISEKAAIQLLGRLFSSADSDELTLDEAYVAAGRADISPETNRNWLNGVLAKLRDYALVTTIDKYENSRSKLDKIKLTMAGKTALGWSSVDSITTPTSTPAPLRRAVATYNDVAKAVAEFRNNNPDFEVIFEVKLKEVNM